MDIQQYENLPIIEQVKIYSQTEPGYIFICSRKNWTKPIFKWNNTYVEIPDKLPELQDLSKYVLTNNVTTMELKTLYKFLTSKNKYGFKEFTVFETCQIAWVTFHPGTDFDS